ncbi:MAG: Holliday junction branch migration protein RuvA [Clostridia bacterium]|nr:Holliday junction branch migration protein RuvA [Clostridia bacterium]
MFYSLTGKIVYSDITSVAVECNGIAFSVTTSVNTLRKLGNIGDIATVYTYLAVREDGVELFGFYDNEELQYFKMLISVSGVGPKAAVAILSVLTPEVLALSITAGDVKSITKAQGVGPKIAQRIVIELKEKVSKLVPSKISTGKISVATAVLSGGNSDEAVNALMALGYSHSEAAHAVASLDASLSVEELIKQALRNLSRR